jgi:hypothetical protein
MKVLVIIAVVIATIGIVIYEFGFQKIPIPPGGVPRDDMIKACNEPFPKYTMTTPEQAAAMQIACKCMADASATALNKKDGTTMIDWMTEVQKNSAACMAKAGISTE